MRIHHGEVVKWIDGDTVDVKVDLGFDVWTFQRFRLARIDAWELKGSERPKGLIAKAWVQTHIPSGSQVKIMPIELGVYRRWIAEIETEKHGNVNDHLLELGHAKPYRKKKQKRTWDAAKLGWPLFLRMPSQN